MTIVASVALTVSACGGTNDADGPEATALQEELSALFQRSENAGLSKTVADCYANILVEEAGVPALQEIDLTNPSLSVPPEMKKAVDAAFLRAKTECPGIVAEITANADASPN